MEEKIIDITQLRHDKKNFNKGTDEGRDMMEKSFMEMPLRSIGMLDPVVFAKDKLAGILEKLNGNRKGGTQDGSTVK